MSGTPVRTCNCRDADRRKLGKACPKLKDRRHGSWDYTVELPADLEGKRKQRHRSGFATKQEAEDDRDNALERLRRGEKINDRETVTEYLDAWLKAKRRLRPSTRRSYVAFTERYFKPLIGHLRVEDLRPEHIEELVERIFEQSADEAEAWTEAFEHWQRAVARAKAGGIKPPKRPKGRAKTLIKVSSVKRIIATLRSALGTGVKKRRLSFNAAAHIELPEYTTPEIAPWSPAEAGRFLHVCRNERFVPLYELVMLEGLRRGEVCGLSWSNVEFELCPYCNGGADATTEPCPICANLRVIGGVLRIRQQRVDVAGHIYEGPPKTKSGERIIEVGQRSLEILVVWRVRQEVEAAQWGTAWNDTGYVFTQEDGLPLRPENVSREFKRLSREGSLRPIRFHDLRHLSASLQLAAGIDLPIVSKRLGHSSVRHTSDLYGHLLKGVGRAASDAASNLIPRQPRPAAEESSTPMFTRDGHVTAKDPEHDSAGLPRWEDPQVISRAAYRNRTDDLFITSEPL